MKKSINRIKTILDKAYKNNSLNIDEVSTLVIQTRQVVEFDQLQEKHKFLNLYCNWFLHTKLQSSITIYRTLENMNQIIFHDSKRNDTNYIVEKISSLLSIQNLRKDFIELYNSKNLPVFLFTDQGNWKTFVSLLLLEISDKPLEFPDKMKDKSLHKGFKKAYKVYSRLRSSSTVSFYSSADTPALELAFVQKLTIIQDEEAKCFKVKLSLWGNERAGGIDILMPLIIKGIE